MKKIIKIKENEVVTIEGNYLIIENDVSSNRKVEIITKLDTSIEELLLGAREIGLVNENRSGKKVSGGVTADGISSARLGDMFGAPKSQENTTTENSDVQCLQNQIDSINSDIRLIIQNTKNHSRST